MAQWKDIRSYRLQKALLKLIGGYICLGSKDEFYLNPSFFGREFRLAASGA
jgi:hypothetical protein